MEITFLGTGHSRGVPVAGCPCEICKDAKNPQSKNRRRRSSILVKTESKSLLIDCGQDISWGLTENEVNKIDALLLTHYHVDHLFGLTDLVYYSLENEGLDVYTNDETQREISKIFPFLLDKKSPVYPKIRLHDIGRTFFIDSLEIMSLPVKHGKKEFTDGFRIGNMAYVSDVSSIPRETALRMQGLDLLILGALQPQENVKHFTIAEAIEFSQKVKAKKTYLTHLSHKVDYQYQSAKLPNNVFLAYDNLVLVM